MKDTEQDEKSKEKSLPLQIDPKWYARRATLLVPLNADRTQLPGCSQSFLSTHQGQ